MKLYKIKLWFEQLFCKHDFEINGFIGMFQCQKCCYIPKYIKQKLMQKYYEDKIN